MKVYQAINRVQADLAQVGIAKTEENKFDRYKFRGIDAVYNALASRLAKHGLCILPRVLERETMHRKSAKGQQLLHTMLDVEFDLVAAEDGSKHTIRAVGEAMDRGDKSVNKAMTAAFKYALFQTFCIPTEGSDDADSESHEVVPDEPTDEDRAAASEFADKITEAATKESLQAVGKELAQAGLPAALLSKLRTYYTAKNKELSDE